MNADQKSLETVFSIAICCQSATNGNQKWFLTIFDLRSSIVCPLSAVMLSQCAATSHSPQSDMLVYFDPDQSLSPTHRWFHTDFHFDFLVT